MIQDFKRLFLISGIGDDITDFKGILLCGNQNLTLNAKFPAEDRFILDNRVNDKAVALLRPVCLLTGQIPDRAVKRQFLSVVNTGGSDRLQSARSQESC